MCAYAREIRVALAGFERSDVRQPCKAVWQDGEERRQMRRRSPAKGLGRAIMPQMATLVRTGIHTKRRNWRV